MATFISHNPGETFAFARRLGEAAGPGLILGLTGDLGSGKTQFAKGFAAGLGVTEPVLSPTFALQHIYETGRLLLWHVDLYRLSAQEEIIKAGLDQFPADGVSLVEWWDRWTDPLPIGFHAFHFTALGDCERQITYDPFGA